MRHDALNYEPPRHRAPRPPFGWVIAGIVGAVVAIVGLPGGELGEVMGVIVGGGCLLYACYRMAVWFGRMQEHVHGQRLSQREAPAPGRDESGRTGPPAA
jgi:hypothetical protein